MKKKILFFALVFLLILPSFNPIRAAFVNDALGNKQDQSFWNKFSQSVNSDQLDIISWTGWPLLSIMSHVNALIGGYPDANGNISFNSINQSLIGRVGKLISVTYSQPISSAEYLAYFSRKLNPVTPVYAQGQGWNFLQPVLTIWKISRDVAYIFFIVIFVAIGFMIMFRKKINPQTVISIQSSLPKIVIALILVTFSYAIAGLIVDFVFLLNSLITYTFFKDAAGNLTNIGQPIAEYLGAIGKGAWPYDILTTVNIDRVIAIFWQSTQFMGLRGLWGGGLNVLLGLFFSITVISTAFKLFITLLTKYITIILNTFISPFIFLWSILPGQGELGGWFRTMFSSILAFPAVYLVLNIAIYFATLPATGFQVLTPFTLDFFSTKAVSGAANLDAPKLIAFGIFLFSPKVPEFIESVFKAEKGAAMGKIMGPELASGLKRIPIIGGLIG